MAIIRSKGKFILVSKKTGRKLSKLTTLKAVKKRERQVQFFKNKRRHVRGVS